MKVGKNVLNFNLNLHNNERWDSNSSFHRNGLSLSLLSRQCKLHVKPRSILYSWSRFFKLKNNLEVKFDKKTDGFSGWTRILMLRWWNVPQINFGTVIRIKQKQKSFLMRLLLSSTDYLLSSYLEVTTKQNFLLIWSKKLHAKEKKLANRMWQIRVPAALFPLIFLYFVCKGG